jgi:hypothetical protein
MAKKKKKKIILLQPLQTPASRKKKTSNVCPQCGEIISQGKMESHLRETHQQSASGSTVGKNQPATWISVYRGGSTGLKK